MESNQTTAVWRRLQSISRHLQPPSPPLIDLTSSSLHPFVLNGTELIGNCDGDGEGGDEAAVVIGGMVLDIHAVPSVSTKPRTTTPGEVHYVLGGVARNVAECVSKLGTKPFMISVIGHDVAGNKLLEHWKTAGLSIEGIEKRQDVGTPVICNIFDMNGELASAVANVEAIEKFLTPKWIQKFKHNISYAPVLMVDANLTPAALEASCQIAAESDTPIWFEPVSVAKSKRIASVVKYVTIVSPNEDELISMANSLSSTEKFQPIQTHQSHSIESLFRYLKPPICVLLDKGIKIVLVTIGSNGILLCSKGNPTTNVKMGYKRNKHCAYGQQLYETISSNCPANRFVGARAYTDTNLSVVHFPALDASVVRLTGAGDCLVGGTLASLCAGLDVFQSVAVGVAAAKAAVESRNNVPDAYNVFTLADDAKTVYAAAKVVYHE